MQIFGLYVFIFFQSNLYYINSSFSLVISSSKEMGQACTIYAGKDTDAEDRKNDEKDD